MALPPRVLTTTTRLPMPGDVARLPDFHGANRRAVLVVSQGEGGDDGPYAIAASLLTSAQDHRPVALPDVFSPNPTIDDRRSTTTITYTLPTLPPPATTFRVDLDLIDPNLSGAPIASFINDEDQDAGKAQSLTWDGMISTATVTDGTYLLQLTAQEYAGDLPRGSALVFTNTLSIDTTPPPPITNLQFTTGPTGTDTLSWTAPTDTSPGGFRQLISVDTQPLTDTTLIQPTAISSSTVTTHTFTRLPSTGYFAVVVEDAAGNRSDPVQLEQEAGKVDVVLLVDASGSMDARGLSAGSDGYLKLIDDLEDNDRVAVREIEGTRASMPLTLVDPAARQTARQTLERYRNPAGDSPMQDALIWALNQFQQPGIATDGRPHIIVVLSDGNWRIDTPVMDRLKNENVTLYAVTAPSQYLDHGYMQRMKRAASAGKQESQFFGVDPNRDDPATPEVDYIIANFQHIARALHGQVVEVQSESVAPGTTKSIHYGIDSRTRQAVINILWDRRGVAPRVTLTAPDPLIGEITPTKLPNGAAYAETPGKTTYTLPIPELPPGLWMINVTNPTAVSAPQGAPAATTGDGVQRVAWRASGDSGFTPAAAQTQQNGGDLAFTLEAGVYNAITTTLPGMPQGIDGDRA